MASPGRCLWQPWQEWPDPQLLWLQLLLVEDQMALQAWERKVQR
jgi:hypothetical protein